MAMPKGSPVDEYTSLAENMRHYANMRFAQLSLYFALTGALLASILAAPKPLGSDLLFVLKMLGALGSACFAVMDSRACAYWHQLRVRAVGLEAELGFSQYADRPRARFFSATNATRVMLWGGVIAWLWLAFSGQPT